MMMLDMLDKSIAIKLHRDLWNTVADMIDSGQVTISEIFSSYKLKKELYRN